MMINMGGNKNAKNPLRHSNGIPTINPTKAPVAIEFPMIFINQALWEHHAALNFACGVSFYRSVFWEVFLPFVTFI